MSNAGVPLPRVLGHVPDRARAWTQGRPSMTGPVRCVCLAAGLLLGTGVRAAEAGEPPGNDGNHGARPPRLLTRLGGPRFQYEERPSFPVDTVALSPDGKVLAAVHYDGT